MQSRWILIIGLLVISLSNITSTIQAQTENLSALEWFNKGVQENDPQQKINYYMKALEQDTKFVEAYFNIGLVYKQLKNYEVAETYLIKADRAKKNGVENDLRTRILFHLAAVQKQLKKYIESEETLLKAAKIDNNDQIKAQITFELGKIYYEQNRYADAIKELREGQRKYKNSSEYFENLITVVENELKVQQYEKDLDAALNSGQIIQAQNILQKIRDIKPSHRGLDEKSAYIDSLLNSKAKDEYIKNMYELAEQQSKEGKFKMAISTYQVILQYDPQNNDAQTKLEALKKQYTEIQDAEFVTNEYDKGLQALQEKNWPRAIIAFEKVLELDSEHEEAKNKLQIANRGLESESTESILRQYYIAGISAMDNKDLSSALASFEKVYNINPKYKDTARLIDEINKSYQAGGTANLTTNDYFKSLYDQAVTNMSDGDWMQAVLVLEKLRLIAPSDHNILNLLIQAKEELKTNTQTGIAEVSNKSNNVVIISAIIALITVPLLGVTVFSPNSRARFHYLRGNYIKAAQLYERLLARHPERLKYYPTLANIYLMLGRNDERALRVYKMLIDLNLAKNIHPQINSVLSQKYLNEGKAEDEAIAILENELKAEQANHSENNNNNL